jgi:hypothetical protein
MRNLSAYQSSAYGANSYQGSAYGQPIVAPVAGPFNGHATLSNGLMAYWGFEGTVTTPPSPDYLGNPTYGGYTFSNQGTGLSSAVGEGVNGNGYRKNEGGDNYFEISTGDFKLSQMVDLTIVAWVKVVSRGLYIFFVDDDGGGFTDYQMSFNNALAMSVFDGDGIPLTVNGTPGTGSQWNLVVGGWDSGQSKVFASTNGEGKIYSSGTTTPSDVGVRAATGLKSMSGTPNVWVDELLIYNRVLTDPEITDLYSAGSGLFY